MAGDFVFTAPTVVLQDFFLKHADDKEVFGKKNLTELCIA